MLTKDRESLEMTHAVGASVSIGNRTATHLGHFQDWETAQVVAFYNATQKRLRCYVLPCQTHGGWMVWQTNVTCRVRTEQDVKLCKQCGLHYGQRACGPTHALQAHRLRLTGVEL